MNDHELSVSIRTMSLSDLNEVVQIHLTAFPDFFLTKLGKGFLYELYKGFLFDKNSICVVAILGSDIQGFVVGNLYPGHFFKKLFFNHAIRFLFYALKTFFRYPAMVLRKLIYALRYRGDQPAGLSNAALLSSIGVHPHTVAKGIGSQLLNEFCNNAYSRGAMAVYLTTDHMDNERVNQFYLKNGFYLDTVFTQTNKRKMNRYIRTPDEKVL